MALPIEQYALLGDCRTAALVGSDGSIDWLCFPRFDSNACFAALLGGSEHGRWLIAPDVQIESVARRYRDGTMILETDFVTSGGSVRIIDWMAISDRRWEVMRIVEGLKGSVAMRMDLVARFDYGSIVPWVRRLDGALLMTAGPDTLELRTSVKVEGEDMRTVSQFTVSAGQRESFVLHYRPSYVAMLAPLDAEQSLKETEAIWRRWSEHCTYQGRWHKQVLRSLLTLKALTYKPTGGVVAAPTTSLPEQAGGVRNWDYRFCWLRDAAFTLNALLLAGYKDEAAAWVEWLLRAVAGSPEDLQILYSVTGARRLDEMELPWLPGYEKSAPVRIGNAAFKQFQLDVYGEVMDTLHLARSTTHLNPDEHSWRVQRALLDFLQSRWTLPDMGIWEIRGPPQHFTHSKVMAWVAFDRAIKDAESGSLEGPVETWRKICATIHAEVCERGFDAGRNTFVQSYGSTHLDASLLLIPQVGFLPPDDPRVIGTIAAIEKNLLVDGLVLRYSTESHVDALPAGECAFLPCSFWLADAFALTGRRPEAQALFERLLAFGNDVGLYAEEYDPRARRMMGNFPQALTHMALVNTARLLTMPEHQAQLAAASGERPAAAVEPAVRPAAAAEPAAPPTAAVGVG
jgi:GH15 family glucan-1,4-alpha-glucosidase